MNTKAITVISTGLCRLRIQTVACFLLALPLTSCAPKIISQADMFDNRHSDCRIPTEAKLLDACTLRVAKFWEQVNQVPVSDTARTALFSLFWPYATDYPFKTEDIEFYGSENIAFIIETILYDARDNVIAQGRNPTDIESENVAASALYNEIDDFLRSQSTRTLAETPLSQFPSYILRVFNFDRGNAVLLVNSIPNNGQIFIDGASEGYTNRKFAMSPGDHTIKIVRSDPLATCEFNINIEFDEIKQLDCPQKAQP